jgi:hypothetical protein
MELVQKSAEVRAAHADVVEAAMMTEDQRSKVSHEESR